MTPVIKTVNSTTQHLLPTTAYLPTGLWTVFNAIHNVHHTWRWYRWGKVYSNPENFLKLSTGHILNYTIGDNILVRIASQCVLISTRIVDCADHQIALSRAYQRWSDCLQNRFPEPVKVTWDHANPNILYIHSKRIRHIAKRSFKLISQMFKLSMGLMDAVEAFSLSPTTRNEAINEVFVNGTQFLDKLSENKQALIEKLKQNKPIIEKILVGIGASYSTDQFIERISKTLTKVNNVNQAIKKVDQFANGFFKDFLKQGIFGFMSALGLADYCPDSLVPLPDKYAPATGKKYGRFAPVHWVTRLNKLPAVPTVKIQQKIDHPTEWIKQVSSNKPIRYIKKDTGKPNNLKPKPIAKPPLPIRFKPMTVDEALEEAQLRQQKKP